MYEETKWEKLKDRRNKLSMYEENKWEKLKDRRNKI
jgi:hypothetical protein